MAFRDQAWLTSVTKDEEIERSLVLVKSLRENNPMRPVGVIVTTNVSADVQKILKRHFDHMVLCFVEDFQDLETKAKIMGFGITFLKKCIYVPPSAFALKNADMPFTELGIPICLEKTWDVYSFSPRKDIWEFMGNTLQEVKGRKFDFGKSLQTWLDKNERNHNTKTPIKPIRFPTWSIYPSNQEFKLDTQGSHDTTPYLVTFKNGPNNDKEFFAMMQAANERGFSCLATKAIVQEWLKAYENLAIARWNTSMTWELELLQETSFKKEPIAIVGMSCRFPGANNLKELWNLLYTGQQALCKPPTHRWNMDHADGYSTTKINTEAGFLVEPVDRFDSKFFGISPKDAELMDPQARLLHALVWEGLENAGIDPSSLYSSNTGIFTGSWQTDYRDLLLQTNNFGTETLRTYLGNGIGSTAARLSFLLGATGPSHATESGCSSGMVCVHLAKNSLRTGETNLAIAAGVNLILKRFDCNWIEKMISPTYRCKTFDASADGFARAEGCGVLVLKRLTDALRDRNYIWGLIRGSGISQEGPSRSLGTPTATCEALAMTRALEDAGVRPGQVSFVETHGTGTPVGDPIELVAINQVYGGAGRDEPLIIGSVKTNIGHTESCSGITGIIKTVLAMQNELIPKHLNLNQVNPDLCLEKIPAVIPLEPMPWPKLKRQSRFAGVSSFGVAGSDAHVILEEAPDVNLPVFTMDMERPIHIMKVSAKSQETLNKLMHAYEDFFIRSNIHNVRFVDAAFTANTGRASFEYRSILIAKNYKEAANNIQANQVAVHRTDTNPGGLCFLFTGQGSQYAGMANLLYKTSPTFRLVFDQCENTLKEIYNLSISPVLWNLDSVELNRTIYSQTSIFVIEYCLLQLWKSWGIKPDYVLGHSLGEFCAAVAAGLLDFEDALKLVVERSLLIEQLPRGSMIAVKASLLDTEKLIKQSNISLDIAALNSTDQTILAGDTKLTEDFLEVCKTHKIKAVSLEATHGFHSCQVDPILERFLEVTETVSVSEKPCSQYISGMKGCLLENPTLQLNSEYWVDHARQKVSFIQACNVLKEIGCTNFLELGPQPVLSTFVLQNLEGVAVNCYPSLRRKHNDWEIILKSLGGLYLRGFNIDWEGFDKPYERKTTPYMPLYPFEGKKYWMDCKNVINNSIHPLLGYLLPTATDQCVFENLVSENTTTFLKDHCIEHMTIFPEAGFTEMCLTAGYFVSQSLTKELVKPLQNIGVEHVRIEAPLLLTNEKSHIQTLVSFNKRENVFECKICHKQTKSIDGHQGKNKDWINHATAKFLPIVSVTTLVDLFNNGSGIPFIMSSVKPISGENLYKSLSSTGLNLGDQFKTIQNYWPRFEKGEEQDLVVELQCPAKSDNYLLHPILIDAMIQTAVIWKLFANGENPNTFRVPVQIGRLVRLTSYTDNLEYNNSKCKLYIYAKHSLKQKPVIFACSSKLIPFAIMEDVDLIDTNSKTIQAILQEQITRIPDSYIETWNPTPGPLENHVTMGDFLLESLFSDKQFTKNFQLADQIISLNPTICYGKLNRLIYLYTVSALMELGWMPKAGQEIEVDKFSETYGIKPMFQQLMHFHFSTFVEYNGLVHIASQNQQDGFRVWKIKWVNPDILQLVGQEREQAYQELHSIDELTVIVDIYQTVARHLPEILRGNLSPLSILFPAEAQRQMASAERYYNYLFGTQVRIVKLRLMLRQMIASVKACNNTSKTKLRILEVGAGTGMITQTVLEVLATEWGTKFEYWFTDISASFFSSAKTKFSKIEQDNLKFCTFNIEELPLEQGIPVNFFDLVVGSNVLHATKDLKACLINIRQTLKPQALLLVEEQFSSKIDRGMTFVFGLLSGCWRFEDFQVRKEHCCVDGSTWEKLLLNSGFQNAHSMDVFGGVLGGVAGIASKENGWAISGNKVDQKKRWVLFFLKRTRLCRNLELALKNTGKHVRVALPNEKITQSETMTQNVMHELLEGNNLEGIIYAWGKRKWKPKHQQSFVLPLLYVAKRLKSLTNPPKLIVLTRGVNGVTDSLRNLNPSPATIIGIVRCLKTEQNSLFVKCLDLSSYSNNKDADVDTILFEIIQTDQDCRTVSYRETVRYEPKLCQALLAKNSGKLDLDLPAFSEKYQLILPKSKMIEDLTWAAFESRAVEENQVEIKIQSYSLNFRDVMTILKPGKAFNDFDSVGSDFAGVISKVGAGVSPETFKIGDRVAGVVYTYTSFNSHIVQDADLLVKIPPQMTSSECSTFPTVFITIRMCLELLGKIKKEDCVLIHTGSGGVGLAAVQMVQRIGARLITTAGNARKRAYLRNLGIEHVFNSRDTGFLKNIMQVTNGVGVDLVLNSITGPGFKEASLAACAKNARFIEMSKYNTWTREEVKKLRNDVFYMQMNASGVNHQEHKQFAKYLQNILTEGIYKPIPFVVYDAMRIRQALKHLQQGLHIGKVVVNMPEEHSLYGVKINYFNEVSTYLITGGLGGIGMVLCKWMLDHGARDIVLVGRSKANPEVEGDIKNMNAMGYNVMVMYADVGNEDECKILLQSIEKNCKKPLRGIQHCTGVLRDNAIENLQWEDFQQVFNGKVYGTWNLHNLTKTMHLEHFVVHSSMCTLMTTPGQANHIAANSFQDAFTNYRHSVGLPAMSINWGQWAQVGVAREVNVFGSAPVSYRRMLNGLEEAMRSQLRQVGFGQFQNLENWVNKSPFLKSYLDERILKGLDQNVGHTLNSLLDHSKFWNEMNGADSRERKMEISTYWVTNILKSILGMQDKDILKGNDRLSDLGVDSLMLIHLQNGIQRLCGTRFVVGASTIKNCDTINDLCTILVNPSYDEDAIHEDSQKTDKELNSTPERLQELLQQDVILPQSIQPPTKPLEIDQLKVAFVTGCTGQLGPYLLSALNKAAPQLEAIICLMRARKCENPKETLERILKENNLLCTIDMAKIHCIIGDITLPCLGLPQKQYQDLTGKVNVVFHLAIKSNHMEPYQGPKTRNDLRNINVGGLLNVLRFASTARTKHVFYPSSWSVAATLDHGGQTLGEEWPNVCDIDCIVGKELPGILVSKYVCEVLLKQAVERGIPCKVFRMSYVLGDTRSGQINYLKNHYLLRLLSYLKIKEMPASKVPAIPLPVDVCVGAAVQLFWNNEAPNDLYNIIHPYPQPESKFIELAKMSYGIEITPIANPNKEFFKRLTASGMPLESFHDFYLNMENISVLFDFPGFTALQSNTLYFESQKIKRYMPEFLKTVPNPMDTIKKSLDYIIFQNGFKKFDI